MTNKELQELRDWSARKMGWDINCEIGPILKTNWQPDNPSTGQIWMLVKEMQELGWRLHLCNPGMMYPETASAGFSLIEKYTMPQRYYKDTNPCLAILKAARATELS